MPRGWYRIFALLVLLSPGVRAATPGAMPVVDEAILTRFEKDVNEMATELHRRAERRRNLEREGSRLEAQVEALRRETRDDPNMLKEAKLNGLLGDLKANLGQRAEEERRAEDQNRTFEEQVLSLAVLYNDRIEGLLTGSAPAVPAGGRGVNAEILRLVGRREALQTRAESLLEAVPGRSLERYPELPRSAALDREDLNLLRGFLKDREARLREQWERADLEMMELRRQIRLEGMARSRFVQPPQTASDPMGVLGVRVLFHQAGHGANRLAHLQKMKSRCGTLLAKTRRDLKTVEGWIKKTPGTQDPS